MRRLVILRPEPGAGQTLERAQQRGLEAISMPLFEVRPVDWSVPASGAFDGLLVTSANAMRHGRRHLEALRHLPAYAVGEATAEAVRSQGLEVAATGDGGVDQLLAMLPAGLRLLHLAGEDRREARSARQAITSVTVYRSEPVERPGDLAQLADAVALIHSPRAGARLAELVSDRSCTAVAAISPAAAAACGEGWERVEAAGEPTDEALLSLAERLCKDSGAT